MSQSQASIALVSLALVALIAPGCAGSGGDAEATKSQAAPKAQAEGAPEAAEPAGGERIAGRPVEGDGKVGTQAGGAGEQTYALEVEPATAAVGSPGEVKIRIVPQSPWHMNLEYPTSLKIAAPDGVTVAKAEQKKGDAVKLDEDGCEFSVAFTPDSAGAKTFTGEFKFAVCQDDVCSPKTETLEFEVAVK